MSTTAGAGWRGLRPCQTQGPPGLHRRRCISGPYAAGRFHLKRSTSRRSQAHTLRRIEQIHSTSKASTRAVLIPESLPTASPAPTPAVRERGPHARFPAMVPVPFTWMLHVPGQLTDPSSQAFLPGAFRLIWPVLLAGAQISRLVHDRSPAGHQADPGQLALPAPGAKVQGEANQVRLFGESAAAFAGSDPRAHGAAQAAPPAAAQVPDEKPA